LTVVERRPRLALAVASKRNADAVVSFRLTLAILRRAGVAFDDAWTVSGAPWHLAARSTSRLSRGEDRRRDR